MILQVGALIAQPQGPPGAEIASGSAKSAREARGRPCQNGPSQGTMGGEHIEETCSALLDTEASLYLSDEDEEPRGTIF